MIIGGVDMRKIEKNCQIHGLTLFRCKRKCRQKGKTSKKDQTWSSEYSERCFKCISEGIKMEISNIDKNKLVKISENLVDLTKKIDFKLQNQFKCIFCGSKPLDKNISEFIRIAMIIFFISIGVLTTVLGGLILLFRRYQ